MSNFNNDFGGEDSDGDDFNPAPAIGSDDEGDGEVDSRPTDRKPAARRDFPERAQSRTARSPSGSSLKNGDDEDEDDGGLRIDEGDPPTKPRSRAVVEDDEDEDDEEEEGRGGDKDDDDDEEDDEEEDEEEAVTGRARKRRRRDPRNQFIEYEAEVDEEDEEEPEDEDDVGGEEMHPDDLLELPAGAEKDDRKHRELDRQRDLAASMDSTLR